MIKVYGIKVSYFTGKLEGYLRYKEIPFEYCPATADYFGKVLPDKTGAIQVPAVELDDGRWMTDTSPIIDWFEREYTDYPILPGEPVQDYVCRLIEDYADEWMWRPAMHYRWSYPASAKLLRRQIVDEMNPKLPIPKEVFRQRTEFRQLTNFVRNDGVNSDTWDHVEQGYLRLLEVLKTILEDRPFVFGERPTLADIGLFGPMFRHFAMDPVPAVIMRETAPSVMEWVYRLWNARGSKLGDGRLLDGIPDDLLPLLKEIGETHLENLCANAVAWEHKLPTFGPLIQGVQYRNVPTSRYRVWCLEQLQERFVAVEGEAKEELTALLKSQKCLEPLTRIETPNSGYDPNHEVPFGRSIKVYENLKVG